MRFDPIIERQLATVELVAGLGTRESGRLCVMSLVALLGGEPHGDSPTTASPLIRAFAIPLNDNMPPGLRQRLKPFAPRILGTADGRDPARGALLRETFAVELLPTLSRPRMGRGPMAIIRRLRAIFGRHRLEREAQMLIARAGPLSDAGDLACAAAAAGSVARLIARAAREAATPAEAERVWMLGLGLLDRLCEVGREDAAAAPRLGAVERGRAESV